ncbi:FRG domain-containing protein [Paenibacillus polymyxa]|uniref:FRG domain-containing protein n=1 Tax=Paenibacillus polymyxa TaxID=1406 RepID=UPI00069679D5|nr:FRG domain-containing protein [Paenibacillus polymyxa]
MLTYDQVVQTVHINSAEELFHIISPLDKQYDLMNKDFMFRGEESDRYSLLPTALRPLNRSVVNKLANGVDLESGADVENVIESNQRSNEYKILRKFFVKSDYVGLQIPHVDFLRENMYSYYKAPYFVREWLPSSFYELAGLAQHYGLPTRLLDWSLDPFVSLYFASKGALNHDRVDESMVLWALHRPLFDFYKEFELPLQIINPPYSGNPNLRAQKGVFTHWKNENFEEDVLSDRKVDRTPLDIQIHKYLSKEESFQKNLRIIMYKFIIPHQAAKNIFKALNTLNYNASTIFPGFEGISRTIEEETLIPLIY